MTPEELARSSSWSPRRIPRCASPADQTARMLTAVQAPRRAHPRPSARAHVRLAARRDGRLGSRVRGGGARGVAIEIDGDPSRQDIDFDLAARGRRPGCLFALDSDAHSTARAALRRDRDRARPAGRRPDRRVVNCWPTDRLLEWLRSKGSIHG